MKKMILVLISCAFVCAGSVCATSSQQSSEGIVALYNSIPEAELIAGGHYKYALQHRLGEWHTVSAEAVPPQEARLDPFNPGVVVTENSISIENDRVEHQGVHTAIALFELPGNTRILGVRTERVAGGSGVRNFRTSLYELQENNTWIDIGRAALPRVPITGFFVNPPDYATLTPGVIDAFPIKAEFLPESSEIKLSLVPSWQPSALNPPDTQAVERLSDAEKYVLYYRWDPAPNRFVQDRLEAGE